jgi:hypothetical protein
MTYRIAVSHVDAAHYNAEVAHAGPAFDDGYQETVQAALGEPVDLLAHARTFAERFKAQHGEGWNVNVVTLTDGEWRVVE